MESEVVATKRRTRDGGESVLSDAARVMIGVGIAHLLRRGYVIRACACSGLHGEHWRKNDLLWEPLEDVEINDSVRRRLG